ncbi:MAG: hypothetical protein ACKORJ_05985 [Bacteroidota bacterium]
MWGVILKAFSVYLASMLKFIFGPIGGEVAGLNIFITMVATVAGMMTVVWVLAYFGMWIRRRLLVRFFRKPKKERTEDQERRREFYRKYGLAGIAFLTPVILTPIGGTLLAIGFGNPRAKIITYMLISAVCWSTVLTLAVYLGADVLVEWFNVSF